jgi:hypothetical protein
MLVSDTHFSAVDSCRARGSGRKSRPSSGRLDGPVPSICTRAGLRLAQPPSAVLFFGDSLQRCRPVQGPRLRPRIPSQPPTRRPARRTRPLHLRQRRTQVRASPSFCRHSAVLPIFPL